MNSLTFPILRLLSDGQFHSGEDIASHFGVTRATIWNALQDAEALGVTLFSVRGRGYRLPEPVRFLDAERIKVALGQHRDTYTLELHDRIDSTNSHLMRQAATGAPHAVCAVAEVQTAGRGRRGRSWQGGLGNSLAFSLLWRFECGAGALSGLSLAVGVALLRGLQELGAQGIALKWPNDVLYREQKLAGILIELQGDMDGPSTAVIGIGLNLRLPSALRQQIDQPAVGLDEVLGYAAAPDDVLGTLLRHLAEVLKVFERGGFDGLRGEWMAHHAFHARPVRMLMPDGSAVDGVVEGIAADGALLVATQAGSQRFLAGEISMRSAA